MQRDARRRSSFESTRESRFATSAPAMKYAAPTTAAESVASRLVTVETGISLSCSITRPDRASERREGASRSPDESESGPLLRDGAADGASCALHSLRVTRQGAEIVVSVSKNGRQ